MAYARYGHLGKGLSDSAQRAYNRAQTVKRITALPRGRGIFQDLAAVAAAKEEYAQVFTREGRLRGSYEALTPEVRAQVAFHEYARVAPTQKQAGLKARGFAGEMTTRYSKHRGMPKVLSDLLEESKEPDAAGGVSIGKLIGLGAIGYGLWVVLT